MRDESGHGPVNGDDSRASPESSDIDYDPDSDPDPDPDPDPAPDATEARASAMSSSAQRGAGAPSDMDDDPLEACAHYNEQFRTAIHAAVRRLFAYIAPGGDVGGEEPRYVRVISHHDGDGIAAAGIVCRALQRFGVPYFASMVSGLDGAAMDRMRSENNNDFWIICDLGSSSLDDLEELIGEIVILDHHVPEREPHTDEVVLVNSHFYDVDGMDEASAATIAYLFAVALAASNWDLVTFALAGAIADKQHLDGFCGLNADLLEVALERGAIEAERGLSLTGENISFSLLYAVAPYFADLSGYEKRVEALLERLGVDGERSPRELDDHERRMLGSYLLLKLLEQGTPASRCEEIVRELYWSKEEAIDIELLADIIDASGRTENQGLGLAVCLGDRHARENLMGVFYAYRGKLIDALRHVHAKGLKHGRRIQYFDSVEPEFASVVAGIGMLYIFDQSRPLFALTTRGERLKISGRATRTLIDHGVNLAIALREAGKELGGAGGGHSIAAGATIPKKRKDEFLGRIDALIGEQLADVEEKRASQSE